LSEWLQSGAALIVKHGPHRTVYHVELPGIHFYLKYYRLPNLRARLRELVRPSKARTEHDRALAVAARGIATITPLALGETPGWRPGESCLITRALDHTEPLNRFLEATLPQFNEPRQSRLRKRITLALGSLIARMHDAGVRHDDLHAGNLLISLKPEDHFLLYLIDLHAVHVGPPLNWKASRDNLVLFNRYFAMHAHRADRLRFWHAYWQARQAGGVLAGKSSPDTVPPIGVPCFRGPEETSLSIPDHNGRESMPPDTNCTPAEGHDKKLKERAKSLEALTAASNVRFWRSRDSRCVAANRHFQKMRGNLVGMAVADLGPAALQALLSNPDEPFGPGALLLKDSRSSTVAEVDFLVAGQTCRVIYKRFRRPPARWRSWLKKAVRRNHALDSWQYGHGLRERCLPTARPLAVLVPRRDDPPGDSYLLTERITDAVDLHCHVAELMGLPVAERRFQLRRGIHQLARLIREMHRRQVAHRDLKATNILVQSRPVDQPPGLFDFGSFCLIDLVGVTLGRPVSRKRRVQNLARLHASFHEHPGLSRADKLRFLRVYLQWGLHGRLGWKEWWQAVAHATSAKVERNLRNGRPLA
jgi:tRNA A-37 threonylcarbamoyl transferase component Bud32